MSHVIGVPTSMEVDVKVPISVVFGTHVSVVLSSRWCLSGVITLRLPRYSYSGGDSEVWLSPRITH